MRDKSTGRECDPKPFVPRNHLRFQIGPNSHPRKVVRYLTRGEAEIDPTKLAKIAKRHVHPRSKRSAS
jgi:hypothetical protein